MKKACGRGPHAPALHVAADDFPNSAKPATGCLCRQSNNGKATSALIVRCEIAKPPRP
jgi:hypothetical protein